MIAAVLALSAGALAASGVIVARRGDALAEQRVATDLRLAGAELQTLATDGLDPATGKPFASAESLLRVAVQRSVTASNEGVLAIVDGKVRWTAQVAVSFRPEQDQEFVAAMLPLSGLDHSSQGRLLTAQRDYRYLVLPVSFGAGSPGGALVRAVDFRAEESLLTEVWASYLLIAIGSLLVVGLLTWVLVGRLLEPLSWMRRTAERITDADLGQRIPIRGSDDLSALGTTVNHMLDRLEKAVLDQRELLDDVGHELRTPLTIIRGHLELLDVSDPVEVASTQALLLDEVDRMGRLVEDLLLLAKAERGDFVETQWVDVARLTDETLVKATAIGARHWVLDELAETEAELDAQRITQAWLQLAANAVKFSAEGSTVGLGSRLVDGRLRLWVRDEGVGISPEDQLRITERFVQAGATTIGSGLGLAIVTAILSAHHGWIQIDSELGRGSTIAMILPVGEKAEGRE